MNKYEYKIEVHMTPDEKGNYFWMLASINTDNPNSQWCNSASGWADSPEKAFAEAKRFYDKYKKEN